MGVGDEFDVGDGAGSAIEIDWGAAPAWATPLVGELPAGRPSNVAPTSSDPTPSAPSNSKETNQRSRARAATHRSLTARTHSNTLARKPNIRLIEC